MNSIIPKIGQILYDLTISSPIKHIFDAYSKHHKALGPSITIIMAFTDNVSSYGDISAKINKIYSNIHNYDFICYKSNDRMYTDGRHITWDKLRWIYMTFLNKPHTQYVFWIDCDAYFSNHFIQLESLLYTNADISLCCNTKFSTNCNTGTMLVKRGEWFVNFLHIWEGLGRPGEKFSSEKYHEQSALDILIKDDTLACMSNNHIALFAPILFNSDALDKVSDSLDVLNQFIVHRMGTSQQFREEMFKKELLKYNLTIV
jgi:hypothetical protein